MLLTRNRWPDIRVTWLTDNTWVNLDWSLRAKCQRFKVPFACLVTMEITGECEFGRSEFSIFSSLATDWLLLTGPVLLEQWLPDWLSSSISSDSVGRLAAGTETEAGCGEWAPGPSRCNKWRKSSTWDGLNKAKWVLKVEASPRGTALGSLELNDTWAWRNDPGVYSSNQSTNL